MNDYSINNKNVTIMNRFNYTLKVALWGGKFVSKNFISWERAEQEWLYYKNCTNANVGILFRADNSIAASFGFEIGVKKLCISSK